MLFNSFVAIGDSFTEGVGDELPGGRVRGWADLVALGLAAAADPEPVTYANLAIRGRLLAPIADGQMNAAIAMSPALISVNGGGNDIMRTKVSVTEIADQLVQSAIRARAAGIHVLLASGANPSRHLPLGRVMEKRGNQLAEAVRVQLPLDGVTFVDNWADEQLTQLRYWSVDKLHLGPLGHQRVAANMLAGLGIDLPALSAPDQESTRPDSLAYWREYVLPWIGRRLTGRSSGDAREPKRAALTRVDLHSSFPADQ